MHAWISKLNDNGTTNCGTSGNYVVHDGRYKSLDSLKRYYLDRLPAGKYKVEIHFYGNYYGEPQKVFTHTVPARG